VGLQKRGAEELVDGDDPTVERAPAEHAMQFADAAAADGARVVGVERERDEPRGAQRGGLLERLFDERVPVAHRERTASAVPGVFRCASGHPA
jgi:hypothetical protein